MGHRNRLRKRRPRLRIFEVLEARQMLVSDLQNPDNHLDVNADTHVSPLDALIIINHLSGHRDHNAEHNDAKQSAEGEGKKLYPDTNGDSRVSPIDVLLIFNKLNGQSEASSDPIDTTGFVSVSLMQVPGAATQLVAMEFTALVTSSQLREVGVFVMDNDTGAVQGVSPQHAAYAQTVLGSDQHQRLDFGDQTTARSAARMFVAGGSFVGIYVLQENAPVGPSGEYLRVTTLDSGVLQVGWEEHQSVWPGLPNVGDRGYDDAVFEITTIEVSACPCPPVLNFIPDQIIDEEVAWELATQARDSDVPMQSLTFSLAPGSPAGLSVNASDGRLQWTPTEIQGPGIYPVTLRVTDNGTPALTATQSFQIEVREVNRPPVLSPLADQIVSPNQTVMLQAQATDPDLPANHIRYSFTSLVPAGTTLDEVTGQIRWTPSDADANTTHEFTVRATDNGSPPLFDDETFTVTVTVADCQFAADFNATTSDESGGTSAGRGSVTIDGCAAVLREGDSFVVALESTFTVPAEPSAIEFTYSALSFDTTDPSFINDAFEVSFVDRDGNSLVAPHASGRDAFFNITEGLASAAGRGIEVDGNRVTIGLNGIPTGTEGKLIFRLANNDSDTTTSVRIDDVQLVRSDLPASSPNGTRQASSVNSFLRTLSTDALSNRNPTRFIPEEDFTPPLPNTWGDTLIGGTGRVTYDTSEEFEQGLLLNLNSTDVPDHLSLNPGADSQSESLIWISNSGEGTVSKFDTRTGKELGRYFTGPGGDNPSRIAVDSEGNAWVANRDGAGTIVKILHQGFIDRNENGVIDTSIDLDLDEVFSLDEILRWDADGDGFPDDERIAFVHEVGGGPRGVAIDANNKVWASPWAGTGFRVYDNETGELETIVETPLGSYGATIDTKGNLWSATSFGASTLMRIDTNTRTFIETVEVASAYGITVDQDGIVWTSPWEATVLSRYDPETRELMTYEVPETSGAGITVDRQGNIWFGTALTNRIWKFTFAADRKTLLSSESIEVGSAPKSASIDADGYLWTVALGDSTAWKIDTQTNTVVSGWPISTGQAPYNYSDMTGDLLPARTQRSGTWTEVIDSSRLNTAWAGVEIDAELPSALSLGLRVRTANDRDALATQTWLDVQPNRTLPGIIGRFIEIESRLRTQELEQQPTIDRISIQAVLPPTITILQPSQYSAQEPGSVLIAGQARPDRPRVGDSEFANEIIFVTINNVPVEQLDAAGNFFSAQEVLPGVNRYAITAHDRYGQTSTRTIYIEGVVPDTIDFARYSDITGAFSGVYYRTSFADHDKRLLVDLATRNDGQFTSDVPLLVGVKNISDPTVTLLDADGFTPDGIPYYDFSQFVTGGKLQPGQETSSPTITFHNPNRQQFDYELVFYGKLNEPPFITTVPNLNAFIDRPYAYDVDAIDPDHDVLTYSLVAAPAAMSINASSGVIAWQPTATDRGSHTVSVRVSDGRGGTAEQSFTLNPTLPPPNRPPVITSEPVLTASLAGSDTVKGSIFLTGHDPDWHAFRGVNNSVGAMNILRAGISFVNDERENVFVAGGAQKLLFVESKRSPTGFHSPGYLGLQTIGMVEGVDFDHHDAATLDQALDELGVVYSAIVVASDFGGQLTQVELNILNSRSDEIIAFLNRGGGLFAMSQSNGEHSDRLTPDGGHFGFLPFVVTTVSEVQDESGYTVTSFGASLGLTNSDVNDNVSHNIFVGAHGLNVVDRDGQERIVSLAGRGQVLVDGFSPATRYEYDAEAFDADGDVLTYSLLVAPDGMDIDPATGLLFWNPQAGQIGNHPVTVHVDDGRGGIATQSYTVCVLPDPANHNPAIVSMATTVADVDAEYSYLVQAVDPDLDPLEFSLADPPIGMTIDPATGLIQWKPEFIGDYPVEVRADDRRGGNDTQQFVISVHAGLGRIEGTKFEDANGDGLRDRQAMFGEPGVSGRLIYLDQNRNGVRDPDERVTVTDSAGNYVFDNLPPGTYVVREELLPGWTQTFPSTTTAVQTGERGYADEVIEFFDAELVRSLARTEVQAMCGRFPSVPMSFSDAQFFLPD